MTDDRTYSQLLEERAVARRATQANAQALSEREAELAYARPMADAAHAYCEVVLSTTSVRAMQDAQDALMEAHEATTPSEVPSSHVIVERTELEQLRLIKAAAEDWATNAARSREYLSPTGKALFMAVTGQRAS